MIRLLPFVRADLSLVVPWFDDPDTQRWLGGPDWPRLMLDLADRPLGEFRGKVQTGAHRWLAWENDRAVGYVDCGTFDRWTVWEGGPTGRGVTATIPVPAGSIGYVVDPVLRRRGYATAMITALTRLPELSHVELFVAGVDQANAGSVGCLERAGFHVLNPQPDWEDTIYFARFRNSARPLLQVGEEA